MKITNEMDCSCAIVATLSEDGEQFTVQMTATATYDEATGATATATVAVPQDKADAIKAALQAAFEACQAHVHIRAFDAVATARKVGQDQGEI